ncbi:MAG: HAMP domain-containing histidine kinase, partial [Ruminococcaceae bacterium]|nr:HAMP domain-containing histidine kinase [Oscillospiraceae bacterium]
MIAFVTIACIGLTAESLLMSWEFWVIPIFILGIIGIWALHITQRVEVRYREVIFLAYSMFAAFFHGVHETSFFDVVAVMLLMVFSMLDHLYMLDLILGEFVIVIGLQIFLAARHRSVEFDPLNISRIALHITVMVCAYLLCRIWVGERLRTAEAIAQRDRAIEDCDKDMEDFLSNISHELRTPINVVGGMSALLLKKGAGEEAESIREAGIRLAYQVEDIQDFTEVKRGQIVVEEENYMATSLIHDVVAGFRRYESAERLELVVDLDSRVPTMMRGDVRKLRKIFRHLVDNAVKFTRSGGIYIRMYAIPRGYGVNLCFELTDTGCGMTRKDVAAAAKGLYQANKKRNRSTGGIGLGLPLVYGLAHAMGGFVKIESERGKGTTVRVTIPQKVADAAPCLALGTAFRGDILFHVRSEKYRVPQVREFYRNMAVNLATGLGCPLYSAESVQEVERLLKKLNVTYIFMGEEEYEANSAYFDELSRSGIVVAISARAGFRVSAGSRVIVMPKPLYGIPVTRILNGEREVDLTSGEETGKPCFAGVRALVVDDEPMNLVVATG